MMIQSTQFDAGRIGGIPSANLPAGGRARLAHVVNVRMPAAEALAARQGARVSDIATALGDPSVGAVFIASSTDPHADLVIAAARAGTAIFCERPIDLSVRRVDACLVAVHGAPATVGREPWCRCQGHHYVEPRCSAFPHRVFVVQGSAGDFDEEHRAWPPPAADARERRQPRWADTPGEHVIPQRDGNPADRLVRAEPAEPFGPLIKPRDTAGLATCLLSYASGIVTGSLTDFDQDIIGAYE